MWSQEDIEEMEANTAYCEHCRECDLTDELVPVYTATRQWHRTEKLVHPECRDGYVAAHLEAVLESLRQGELETYNWRTLMEETRGVPIHVEVES